MTTEQVTYVKKQIEGIRLSFGTLLLVLCCTFLIILATFLQLNVTHFIIPSELFDGDKQLAFRDFIFTYRYIPQIPTVMFIGAFLGRKYGITSVLLYIILGLCSLPIFALGGGFKYIFEYGFGYILAYVPAIFFAGLILKNGFTIKNMIKAVLAGVLTIHIMGILYMLFVAGLKHEGLAFISGWISAQSGIKIIYDMIFSFAALFIAKYAKIILWFFM